jgi:predicted PurR-regulated permease PerM
LLFRDKKSGNKKNKNRGDAMSELVQLQKKQNRIYILVCINFLLFIILFAGLGVVTWQSATLVSRLNKNLGKAEQTIVELQSRFEKLDTDMIVKRLVSNASEQLGESIRTTLKNTDFTQPIAEISNKIVLTQEMIGKSGEAMQKIQEKMNHLDNDEIAQRVSYHVIKGLGDGFQKAADDRLPPVKAGIETKTDAMVEDK